MHFGKSSQLGKHSFGHYTTLLGHDTIMRTSCFDTDFVSEMKLTTLSLCFVHTRCLRLRQRRRRRQINIDAENGFRPILCVSVCVTIDAMLNFDSNVDANATADIKCEHTVNSLLFNFL